MKRFKASGLPDRHCPMCLQPLAPAIAGASFLSPAVAVALPIDVGEGTIQRVVALHLRPGDLAPATGTYQEHNVFGTETGRRVAVKENEPLPSAPRGFTWSAVPCADE